MRWRRSAASVMGVDPHHLLAQASSVLDPDVIEGARQCLEKPLTGRAWSFEEPVDEFQHLCALVAERQALLETLCERVAAADLDGTAEVVVDAQLRLRWLDWLVGGVAATLWVPGACSYFLRGLSRQAGDPSDEEASILAEVAWETMLFSDTPLEALPLVNALALRNRSVLHQIARVRALRLEVAPELAWHDQMKSLLLQAGPPFVRGGLPNPVIEALAPELAEGLSGTEPREAISWIQEWLRLHDDLSSSFRSLADAPRLRVRFVGVLLLLLRLYIEVGDAHQQRTLADVLIEDLGLGDAPLDPAVPDDSSVSEHRAPRAHLLDGRTEVVLIDTASTDRTPPEPGQVRDWVDVSRKARSDSVVLLSHGLPAPTETIRTRKHHSDPGAALEKELEKQLEESRSNGQTAMPIGPVLCQTQVFGDCSSGHPAIWFTLPGSENGWAVGASIIPGNGRRFSYLLRVGRAAQGRLSELAAALAARRPAAVNSLLEEVDRLLKRANAYL